MARFTGLGFSGDLVVVKVQHAGIEEKKSVMTWISWLAWPNCCPRTSEPVATPASLSANFGEPSPRSSISPLSSDLKEFARHLAKGTQRAFSGRLRETVQPARADHGAVDRYQRRRCREGLHGSGLDLDEVARRGADMYLEMIFRDGFYHADPHPGNLMMLPGGVVGVLDCGMVGRIDDQLREEIEGILLAILQLVARAYPTSSCTVRHTPPELDVDGLRAEISSFVAEYANLTASELNLSKALNRATDVVRRYRIVLPASGALLLRTLVMLEGTAKLLNPSFSLAQLIQPYATKTLLRRFSLQRFWQATTHISGLGPAAGSIAAQSGGNPASAYRTQHF